MRMSLKPQARRRRALPQKKVEEPYRWPIISPHPLEGKVFCFCGPQDNHDKAVLYVSRTSKNLDRQFFRCPNLDEHEPENFLKRKCSYFKWADEISGPGVVADAPPPSSPSSRTQPSSSQSSQPARPSGRQASPPYAGSQDSMSSAASTVTPAATAPSTYNAAGPSGSIPSRGPSTSQPQPQTPSKQKIDTGGMPPGRTPATTPRSKEERMRRLAKLQAGLAQEVAAGSTKSATKPISPDPSPTRMAPSKTALEDDDTDDDLGGPSLAWPAVRRSEGGRTLGLSGAGLPSPLQTPENSMSDIAGSPSKRKREDMEDIGNNPFLSPSTMSSRASVTSVPGPSRITILENRLDAAETSNRELSDTVQRQADAIASQATLIERLQARSARFEMQMKMLNSQVLSHGEMLLGDGP